MNTKLEQEVIEACNSYIVIANKKYRLNIQYPTITFNLTSTSAGRTRGNQIQFNRILLEQNREKFLDETVPHEIAHVVEFYKTGKMGHRKQWKDIMKTFGVNHCNRCHNYDVSVLCKPIRKETKVRYKCHCREHLISMRRHNKILNEDKLYTCRKCGMLLTQVSEAWDKISKNK